jgi:NADH dehydrogenase (ubiquinone) 1 beta subcomplex subunit 7
MCGCCCVLRAGWAAWRCEMATNTWFESSADKYKWFDVPIWWQARLNSKFLPEEEWLIDDLYLGYGFDTPITRLRRPPRKMNISTEEMKAARISPRMRTWCAHHIPALQTCRYNNYWLPWKCEHEREMYEKCRFKDYLWRHRLKDLILLDREAMKLREEEARAREAAVMAGAGSGSGDHH